MKKLALLFGIISSTVVFTACDEQVAEQPESLVVQTDDLERIKGFVNSETNKKDLLVVFDCDEVLLSRPDPSLQRTNGGALVGAIELLENELTADDITKLLNYALVTSPQILVDEGMPDLVKHIQNVGAKTVVLTQLPPGSYGTTNSIEETRSSQLNNLGYFFEISWPDVTHADFKSLEKTKERSKSIQFMHTSKNYPVFYKGILFCGYSTKKEVLEEFFKKTSKTPKTIIFIDDSGSQVKSIAEFCAENNINYVGIEYTGWKKIDTGSVYSSEQLAEQFRLYAKAGIWSPIPKTTSRK